MKGSNTPRNFAALNFATLYRNINGKVTPQDPIDEHTLEELIAVVETSRDRNDTKAAALVRAVALQAIAVIIVGITVMVVIV